MATAQYGLSLSAGGVTIQKTLNRTGTPIGIEESLPVGLAGTLSTRTDNDTGVVTVASGHGITASDTVDLYWSGGMRYSVDVTAAGATTIDIDVGLGDNLPIATTAVVIVKQVTINALIDGDNLKILGYSLETSDTSLTTKGHILLEDAAGDDIVEIDLTANSPIVYDIEGGASNSFTGDIIVVIRASNANSSVAATLKIVGVYDASP